MTDLRELVARALFNDRFRLREWDHAKEWHKKVLYRRADEALRRAGLENVKVKSVRILKVENVR